MTYLKFTVIEDGKLFSAFNMTEPESFAIKSCVDSLLPAAKSEDYWFEADLTLVDDEFMEMAEEPDFGIVRCYQVNTHPQNGSLGEERLTAAIPDELVQHLKGKTFRIQPVQYGLSPWGKKVEVVFE